MMVRKRSPQEQIHLQENQQQRLYNLQLQQMKERPVRIFVEPQKISKHLLCPICHEVFDNPNRLGCGHTFCYLCIQQWAAITKVCPCCKKSLKHRRPEKDLIASSMIDDLQAKCHHQKCVWTGVYSSLKKHQRGCEHREKKTNVSRNFDEIVELNDEDQIKEDEEANNKCKKRLKKDEANQIPNFPPSSESQSLNSSDMQEHPQDRNQLGSFFNDILIRDQMRNKFSQSLSHSNNSSNSSGSQGYLDVNFQYLMPSRANNHSTSYQSQPQPNINQQLNFYELSNNNFFKRNVGLEDSIMKNRNDGYLYQSFMKNPTQGLNNQQVHSVYSQQMEKNEVNSNYFIIQQNKREQKQKKQLKSKPNNKWGQKYKQQNTKNDSLQKKQDSIFSEDSSELSNPFNEPIVSVEKKSTKDLIIILDSSEDSKLHQSIQSGEVSMEIPKINNELLSKFIHPSKQKKIDKDKQKGQSQ